MTVTYDAEGLVRTCLDSLGAQRLDGLRMQVVVVDNASRDATARVVADEYPEVRLVRAPRNLGFAAGNNLALRDVRSRYVVLVNNDAVVAPDAVRALVRALDDAPDDVAAMAATVLLAARFRAAGPDEQDAAGVVHGPDGRWVPDPEGAVRLVNSTGNEVRTDGFGQDRGWLADHARHAPGPDVFGFSGAAAVLRTSALRDVGLFDESFFMYYEDTDLSWRLRLAGYRVEHCPGAVVEHVHAASAGEGSDFFRFHDARNRLALLTKDATARTALRALARYVVTTASLAVRRRRWDLVRTRVRALASYGCMLPGLLRERRRVGRAARVPRARVEDLLVPATRGYTYRS
ncbi:glycosyl transferase [Cellulomonas phragmiteti]|uniref:Glycosyl transferase n=1 Tax=Cellulomonas phragmiteti TaxID=478780 RepID=A0ABQ4DJS3_9CELL|nr:glycosyl transferase [Cellulomonas phragmiteti]